MALVVRDATARLVEPNYRPDYADTITGAVLTEASELRSLVDTDLLPPGTTLAAGDGAGQQLAHVLPDGRAPYTPGTPPTTPCSSTSMAVEPD